MFISPIGSGNTPARTVPAHAYIVQRGDTLAGIAAQHHVPYHALRTANPQIVNPDVIYPGQTVHVPAIEPAQTQASVDGTASISAGDGQDPSLDLTADGKFTHTRQTGTDANGTKATQSGKLSLGSDGSITGSGSGSRTTTRTNASGTKTTTSSQGSGSVAVNPDAGTVSLSAGGGFSKEVTNAKGRGISFGIDANATVVTGKKTAHGVTTYSASSDASITLDAGIKARQAGLQVGYTKGIKVSYEVSMPEKAAKTANLATVNPFDPASMPKGTVIKLDGSHYTTGEFEATFRNIANKYSHTDAKGTSLLVEKTGANTVRVTAGPTRAIDAYNGIGVDFGVASAMLGRDDSLSGAALKTAQFDLSTANGKAAFNDFATNGRMPADNGDGISGVKTIEKLDYASQTKLDAKLGPLSFGLDGPKNTGSSVLTIEPDGSMTRTVDLQYSGNAPLTINQKFDTQGKEIASARTYTYTIKVDANNAQLINAAQTGDLGRAQDGPVKAGQTIAITYSVADLRALSEDAQTAIDASHGMDFKLQALTQDYDGKALDTEQLALALARNVNESSYGIAANLLDISRGADGHPFNRNLAALPGTIAIVG